MCNDCKQRGFPGGSVSMVYAALSLLLPTIAREIREQTLSVALVKKPDGTEAFFLVIKDATGGRLPIAEIYTPEQSDDCTVLHEWFRESDILRDYAKVHPELIQSLQLLTDMELEDLGKRQPVNVKELLFGDTVVGEYDTVN